MAMVLSARVNEARESQLVELERRAHERHECRQEGVTRPLDTVNGLSWGAIVTDVSHQGVGLALCYPFRPGTYLVVDLQGSTPCSLLARVVHVEDQHDGTWHVGCELLKKLSDEEIGRM